jgi:hypothetical protein
MTGLLAECGVRVRSRVLFGNAQKGQPVRAHFGVQKHFLFCDCVSRALRPYFDFLHKFSSLVVHCGGSTHADMHTQ